MPGHQTLTVLDNYFNESTGQLEEVIYTKEFIIEHMTADINKLSNSETLDLQDYLNKGIIPRYLKIKRQAKKEIKEAHLRILKEQFAEELKMAVAQIGEIEGKLRVERNSKEGLKVVQIFLYSPQFKFFKNEVKDLSARVLVFGYGYEFAKEIQK